MQFVGSYQAKTRLPELFRQVEQGEIYHHAPGLAYRANHRGQGYAVRH